MDHKTGTLIREKKQPKDGSEGIKASPTLLQKRETEAELFKAIANYTYDWESWIGPNGEVNWVNPAVERITGYSPEECLGMETYPLPLIHKKDIKLISRCMRKAAKGLSGNDIEFRILRKDHHIRWGAVSWQSITDNNNTPIGYRTSVRDITDRKIAEDELLSARLEAERANQAKSQFLAAASHDLRQPIQAIGMFASALRSAHGKHKQTKIITAIQDSVHATDELLNALLDISRLDSNTITPETEVFAIADILELAESEFTLPAQEKNLNLRTVQSSAIVKSDPILVERIIRNFISNALRYTPNGKILLGCRLKKKFLRVEVMDTGIGIALQDHKAIFEEFHQISNPERNRNHGLGLGLAIVKRIAKILSLNVGMESTEGKGSVFFIDLPLTKEKIKNPALSNYDNIDISGRFILYIDDDPMQLAAMQTVLLQANCDILTASSPEEAIEQLKISARIPDVLIADYRLRENITGTQAIRQICDFLKREIPAAILTGDTEPNRIAEAARSGIILLHKPLRVEVLKQTILSLILEL